jgi:hypothetical protein
MPRAERRSDVQAKRSGEQLLARKNHTGVAALTIRTNEIPAPSCVSAIVHHEQNLFCMRELAANMRAHPAHTTALARLFAREISHM